MRTSTVRILAAAALVALVPVAVMAGPPAGTVRQLTYGDECNWGEWSPNGAWIAYQRDTSSSSYGIIYKIKSNGTMDTPLTQLDRDWYCDSKPTWSPDGRWIAFQRFEADPAGDTSGHLSSIWKMKANGTAQARVAKYEEIEFDGDPYNDGAGAQAPEYSPDGQWIAFRRGMGDFDDDHTGVFVIRPDGTGEKRVTRGSFGFNPQLKDIHWKPAGTGVNTLLVASMTNALYYNNGNWFNIALINRSRPAADKWLTNGFGYTCQHTPEWSPNGRKVTYKDDMLGQGDIWTMKANGRGKVRITESSYAEYIEGIGLCYNNPTFSPNNKYIAYFQDDDNGKFVGVMTANGAHRLLLTDDIEVMDGISDSKHLLSWNPQGTKILFQGEDAGGDDQLFVIDLDTADDDGDGKKNWEEVLLAN